MGMEKKTGVEKLEKRFLKWVLGMEARTPEYMVRKEMQRDKLGKSREENVGF